MPVDDQDFKEAITRRIGGLETPASWISMWSLITRRIGGLEKHNVLHYYPPYRWLRNNKRPINSDLRDYPPYRRLRNSLRLLISLSVKLPVV